MIWGECPAIIQPLCQAAGAECMLPPPRANASSSLLPPPPAAPCLWKINIPFPATPSMVPAKHISHGWTFSLRPLISWPDFSSNFVFWSKGCASNPHRNRELIWINRWVEICVDLWAGFVWVRASAYSQYVLLLNTCRSCYIRLYMSVTDSVDSLCCMGRKILAVQKCHSFVQYLPFSNTFIYIIYTLIQVFWYLKGNA